MKVALEVLVTEPTAAVALWAVDRPPGLSTSMVTVRTWTLPVSTSTLPLTWVMVPVSTSKVESRVTEALWPTEKAAASSAGRALVR